jgi:hypothetical protein
MGNLTTFVLFSYIMSEKETKMIENRDPGRNGGGV